MITFEKGIFLKYNCYPINSLNRFAAIDKENLFKLLSNNNFCFSRPTRERFKINKFILYIHGTYNCNASCVYCINQQLRKDYCGKIIDDKTISNIILKLGPYIEKAIWHGGEPLLIPEEKMKLFENLKNENNLYFPTTLQTNLINLTEEKKKFLREQKIGWGTSFDGLSNSCNRGEQSTQAFLNELQINPNLSCLSVVTDKEINNLIENYEYQKSLGLKHFTSSLVRENIDNSNAFLLTDAEQNANAVYEYIKYWMYDKEQPILDKFIENEIISFFGASQRCESSFSIGKNFIIDPYGNLNLCAHHGLKNNIININDINNVEQDFFNNKNLLEELDAQFKFLQKCEGAQCPVYYRCYGGCMGENYTKSKYQALDINQCNFKVKLHNMLYELLKDIDVENSIYNPLFRNLLKKLKYFSLTELQQRGVIINDNN